MGVAASAVTSAVPPDVPVVTEELSIHSHREMGALLDIIIVS